MMGQEAQPAQRPGGGNEKEVRLSCGVCVWDVAGTLPRGRQVRVARKAVGCCGSLEDFKWESSTMCFEFGQLWQLAGDGLKGRERTGGRAGKRLGQSSGKRGWPGPGAAVELEGGNRGHFQVAPETWRWTLWSVRQGGQGKVRGVLRV